MVVSQLREPAMRSLALLILTSTILAGCVVVPIAGPPGVYVGVPVPAIVVHPYGYGYDGYYGGRGYRHWH
jgi:hypothetical protein